MFAYRKLFFAFAVILAIEIALFSLPLEVSASNSAATVTPPMAELENAVIAAALEQIPYARNHTLIVDAKIAGEWARGALIIRANPNEEAPSVEEFIAKHVNGQWEVAFKHAKEYWDWLAILPEELISQEEKEFLLGGRPPYADDELSLSPTPTITPAPTATFTPTITMTPSSTWTPAPMITATLPPAPSPIPLPTEDRNFSMAAVGFLLVGAGILAIILTILLRYHDKN